MASFPVPPASHVEKTKDRAQILPRQFYSTCAAPNEVLQDRRDELRRAPLRQARTQTNSG